MITLTIDDNQVQVNAGVAVYEAAKDAGVYIPTLCYHHSLSPYEGCRLCIVEIENTPGLPPSCTTPATDGIAVRTKTPQLQEFRRGVLELVLTEHPQTYLICDHSNCEPYRASIRKVGVTTGCQFCPQNKQCELQEVAVIDCADGYSKHATSPCPRYRKPGYRLRV